MTSHSYFWLALWTCGLRSCSQWTRDLVCQVSLAILCNPYTYAGVLGPPYRLNEDLNLIEPRLHYILLKHIGLSCKSTSEVCRVNSGEGQVSMYAEAAKEVPLNISRTRVNAQLTIIYPLKVSPLCDCYHCYSITNQWYLCSNYVLVNTKPLQLSLSHYI